jgi:pimeloyl-ACP methyl ester carboxylesterase
MARELSKGPRSPKSRPRLQHKLLGRGDRDPVVAAPGMDQLLANLKNFVPALRDTRMLPGCGHWTQQERPDEVNAAMLDFLRDLPS